jgi:HK97 gp10 family phage protein
VLKMAKFKVEGLRELERALAELPKATAKNTLKRTLKLAAQPIADEAQRLAPRDTGGLAEGIMVTAKKPKKHKPKSGRAFAEIYIGPKAKSRNAVPQEFGTSTSAAQPFMRPAWDSKKMEALEIIRDELGNQITKAAERLAKKAARKAAKGA